MRLPTNGRATSAAPADGVIVPLIARVGSKSPSIFSPVTTSINFVLLPMFFEFCSSLHHKTHDETGCDVVESVIGCRQHFNAFVLVVRPMPNLISLLKSRTKRASALRRPVVTPPGLKVIILSAVAACDPSKTPAFVRDKTYRTAVGAHNHVASRITPAYFAFLRWCSGVFSTFAFLFTFLCNDDFYVSCFCDLVAFRFRFCLLVPRLLHRQNRLLWSAENYS